MIKISRPVVYVTVLGVAAYAVVLVTEPDPVPKKSTKHTSSMGAKDQNGITAEDLKAHFARYTGQGRDTFIPKVIPKKGAVALASVQGPPPGKLAMGTGTWELTGITTINNTRSAVMENSNTHEIFFLKAGDVWNGMHVTAVNADSIMFANAANQETRVSFAVPKAEEASTTSLRPTLSAPQSFVPAGPASQTPGSGGPAPQTPFPTGPAGTNTASPDNTPESVNPQ